LELGVSLGSGEVEGEADGSGEAEGVDDGSGDGPGDAIGLGDTLGDGSLPCESAIATPDRPTLPNITITSNIPENSRLFIFYLPFYNLLSNKIFAARIIAGRGQAPTQ